MKIYAFFLLLDPITQVTNDRHQSKLGCESDSDVNWNDLLRKLANYILVTINTTKVGV